MSPKFFKSALENSRGENFKLDVSWKISRKHSGRKGTRSSSLKENQNQRLRSVFVSSLFAINISEPKYKCFSCRIISNRLLIK